MSGGLYAALLRAVNLAGRNVVPMAALREMTATLGMTDVRTMLQSGNVVFRTARGDPARIEQRLEQAAARQLGVATDFFVRAAAEWHALVDANPFRTEARREPGRLLVMFLKDAPDRARVTALQQAIAGREVVEAVGRHAYIVYPDGIGRSRLTIALVEKHLVTHGTGRNWNTVLKLRDVL